MRNGFAQFLVLSADGHQQIEAITHVGMSDFWFRDHVSGAPATLESELQDLVLPVFEHIEGILQLQERAL